MLSCILDLLICFIASFWFHVCLGLIFSVMMKPDDESDLYPFYSPWRQYEAFVWEKINPRFIYLLDWLLVTDPALQLRFCVFLINWFWCKFVFLSEKKDGVCWRWKWWFFPQMIEAEYTERSFSSEKPSQDSDPSLQTIFIHTASLK